MTRALLASADNSTSRLSNCGDAISGPRLKSTQFSARGDVQIPKH